MAGGSPLCWAASDSLLLLPVATSSLVTGPYIKEGTMRQTSFGQMMVSLLRVWHTYQSRSVFWWPQTRRRCEMQLKQHSKSPAECPSTTVSYACSHFVLRTFADVLLPLCKMRFAVWPCKTTDFASGLVEVNKNVERVRNRIGRRGHAKSIATPRLSIWTSTLLRPSTSAGGLRQYTPDMPCPECPHWLRSMI